MGTLGQVAVGGAAFALVAAVAFWAPRRLRSASPLVVGIALGAAVVGALVADTAPTGASVYDAVLRVVVAIGFVAAGCYATRGPRLAAAVVLAAASLLGAGSAWPAVAGFGACFALVVLGTDGPAVGALVGLALGQGALRLDWPDATGASVAVGVVAFAIVGGSAFAHLRGRTQGRIALAAVVLALFTLVVGVLWAGAALSARHDLSRGVEIANAGLDAARAGDTATAAQRFDEAAALFAHASDRLDAAWLQPVRAVPIAAQNARALRVMTDAGNELSVTGAATARSANPDDVRPRNGVVPLDQVRALDAPFSRAAGALARARADLANLDSPWLVSQLATKLHTLDGKVARGARDAQTARLAVEVLPRVLGAEGQRRYFVAFQTPAEQRANGGLIGNFAEITYRNGDIDLTRNARDSEYNDGNPGVARVLHAPEDYVRRYGVYQPQNLIQSLTLSPDFPSVAQAIEGVYPQGGGDQIDGVISFDPIALASFLQLTGNVTVPGFGVELTPANAADILLRAQYEMFPDSDERVEFLKATVRAVFDRLDTTELPGPKRIGEVLGPMTREGRLQIHSVNRDEQAFFRRIGADRHFPATRGGDFLGIATQNSGGNKIDVFQHRDAVYDAEVDPSSGAVTATATVRIRNDAPASGLPDYVIGSFPNNPLPRGTNRVLVSVYTPHELESATVDGVDATLVRETELGRSVYTAQLEIPPGGERMVVLHLRGGVDLRGNHDRYRLKVWHQATVNPDRTAVQVRATPGWSVTPGRGLGGTPEGAAADVTLQQDATFTAGFESL